jgi:hypothetical protein
MISMTIPLGLKISFGRNMVAVRTIEGWVLLNPVRLSEEAEADLLKMAPIKHAVRLGGFHGRDDRYYVDKFDVEFWGVPGIQAYPEPKFTREISENGQFPISDARVVIFKDAKCAECVVCLPQHKLLLTCDSVQHYDRDSFASALAKVVMYPMGFFVPCVIGPIWLKMATPPGGSLRADFERVLALEFDNLIGGHGSPKIGGAKAALAKNVARLPILRG